MLRSLVGFVLALAAVLAVTGRAAAQEYLPVSTEATFGFRSGHGGTYTEREGMALDAVLAYRLGGSGASMWLGGFSVAAQTPVVMADVCVFDDDGGCVSNFPSFLSAGVLVGVQRGTPRTFSARLMAGPGYYVVREGGSAAGLEGRADLATPPWRHTAVVVSLRNAVLPDYDGSTLRITSAGIGLRIQ